MFFLNVNGSMLMNANIHVSAITKYNFSLCLRFGYIFINVKLLNKDYADDDVVQTDGSVHG